MTSPRILCLAVRTSGPNASIHSIVEIGARFFSGPRIGEEFSGDCSIFPGAQWDDRTEDLTGLCRRHFIGDHYSDTESETLDRFCAWLGAGETMLAGFRPGPVRSFIAAAYARARGSRIGQSAPRFTALSLRSIDLHSVYVAARMRRGEPVPSGGFRQSEICHACEISPFTQRDPAIHTARREGEVLAALLR